jgi:hypothetical protein
MRVTNRMAPFVVVDVGRTEKIYRLSLYTNKISAAMVGSDFRATVAIISSSTSISRIFGNYYY